MSIENRQTLAGRTATERLLLVVGAGCLTVSAVIFGVAAAEGAGKTVSHRVTEWADEQYGNFWMTQSNSVPSSKSSHPNSAQTETAMTAAPPAEHQPVSMEAGDTAGDYIGPLVFEGAVIGAAVGSVVGYKKLRQHMKLREFRTAEGFVQPRKDVAPLTESEQYALSEIAAHLDSDA
jgi:hypothetical protein